MNKSYIFTFFASLLLILIAFSFQDKLSHFKSLGLLGIFLINFLGSATIFVPTPAIASVFAGGLVYPPILVAIISALGASFGDMIGFLLGHVGRKIFIKNHHSWYIFTQDMFKKFGGIIIFIFALIPNPLFDGIGIAAGALSFSPTHFFLLMFLGRLLRNILLAYLGSVFAR